MNITKKAITDDIAFISSTLKQQDVAIPPFLSCAMPGLAVMLCMLIMPLWNLFSNLAYFQKYGLDLMARLDDLIPLLMFFIFGFFIFISIIRKDGEQMFYQCFTPVHCKYKMNVEPIK